MAEPMRDFATAEIMAWTARDLVELGVSLGVHCAGCRILRDTDMARLAEARAAQPVGEIVFRCRACGRQGSAVLTWRGEANAWRSFDYAQVKAAEAPG